MSDLFFALGSSDHEMQAIEDILTALKLPYGYVSRDWVRTTPASAYYDSLGLIIAGRYRNPHDSRLVTIECNAPFHLSPYLKIDHHRVGDSGYDCNYREYWKGSSIGQLITLLIKEGYDEEHLLSLTADDPHIIAANDHCPAHAAHGMIPEISIQAFLDFRLKIASRRTGETPEAIMHRIHLTMEIIKKYPHYELGGIRVCKVERSQQMLYLRDASLAAGVALEYTLSRENVMLKRGIMNCISPNTVELWIQNNENVLFSMYGAPKRGYAAGFVNQHHPIVLQELHPC